MIKILLLNLILFTTLSLVNCAGSAGAPTDPPSGNPSQNQTDPTRPGGNGNAGDSGTTQGDNNDPGTSGGNGDTSGTPSDHSSRYRFNWREVADSYPDGFHTYIIESNGNYPVTLMFEGNWSNGLPNGQATITSIDHYSTGALINGNMQQVDVVSTWSGTLVNGLFNGTVVYYERTPALGEAQACRYEFDVEMGCVAEGIVHCSFSSDCLGTWEEIYTDLLFGISLGTNLN
ncbi:MAG: hypothetical protein FWD44_06040 [Oscillospiraceae bacterium]|nr:hypothetical protein [Oscillospiraceae bacterium]